MRYTEQELESIWVDCVKNKIQQKKEEWFYVLNILNNFKKTDNIIDIGTYDGGTSVSLKYFAKNMVTIDAIPSPRFDVSEFRNINYNYIGNDSHSEDTFNTVKSLIGDKINVLFIDGDHSYEGVKQDFEMYKTLLDKGNSLIFFHDIVDSDFHRSLGCNVSKLWYELENDPNYDTEKFTTLDLNEVKHGGLLWGGIGLIRY